MAAERCCGVCWVPGRVFPDGCGPEATGEEMAGAGVVVGLGNFRSAAVAFRGGRRRGRTRQVAREGRSAAVERRLLGHGDGTAAAGRRKAEGWETRRGGM